jgi:hypothetical protein
VLSTLCNKWTSTAWHAKPQRERERERERERKRLFEECFLQVKFICSHIIRHKFCLSEMGVSNNILLLPHDTENTRFFLLQQWNLRNAVNYTLSLDICCHDNITEQTSWYNIFGRIEDTDVGNVFHLVSICSTCNESRAIYIALHHIVKKLYILHWETDSDFDMPLSCLSLSSYMRTKHTNTPCGQSVEYFHVKRGDIYIVPNGSETG